MRRIIAIGVVSLCALAGTATAASAAAPPLTDVTASIDCGDFVDAGTFAVCSYSATNTGVDTLTCRATIYLSEGGTVQTVATDDDNVIAAGQSFSGKVKIRTSAAYSSGNGRIVVRCQSRDGFVSDQDGFTIRP